LLIFIIKIHTNTCHLLKFSNMRLNTTLGILLTFYNTCKFKDLHNLIVGVCWSVNELVTTVIHLTQKSKHIVKMFAIHPFSFFSQRLRSHYREVKACIMWHVNNCDKIFDVILGDDVE
jgi:hypothetical protein